MEGQPTMIYRYDGSFDGLLCCVFASYLYRETPDQLVVEEDFAGSLFPSRYIPTDLRRAGRVSRGLAARSPRLFELAWEGMATALPHRDLLVFQLIRLAFSQGEKILGQLTHPVVHQLGQGVTALRREAHLYTGFVRFTQAQGVLVAQIAPKGQVLGLIASHFAGRYPDETFLIFDQTHQTVLVHRPGETRLMAAQLLEAPSPSPQEAQYQQMWRAYCQAVSIQSRKNPRCQMTHLPKRYRPFMTEFSPPGPGTDAQALPAGDGTGR